MILKRPYKLLIKYFKLIHIIMLLVFSYLVFILRNIYDFFIQYVKTGNYTYMENIAQKYIPIYIFFFIILIIFLTIFIYQLMKRKNKPVLYYQGLFVYSVILLILFVYLHSFFISLNQMTFSTLQIVISRDIVAFAYYLNFFYIAYSFIRGFGFDIKKFSFELDKKALDLEETDNEEFEFNVSVDKDKVKQRLNRQKREFGYFVKENKRILVVIFSILVVGLSIYGYLFYFVNHKIYQEKDVIVMNGVSFKVNKSYLTEYDKYGEIVYRNSTFLVIDLNIQNNQKNLLLDKEMFRINILDKYYYPVYNFYDDFEDLGVGYKNETIKEKSNQNYILVFKLEKVDSGNIYLEFLKNKKSFEYFRMHLNPEKSILNKMKVYLNDELIIGKNSLKINSYEFVEKTSYEYQECQDKLCNKYLKMIKPKLGNYVLVFDIENSSLTKEFFNHVLGMKYQNNVLSGKDIQVIDMYNNKLYLDVPRGSMASADLEMIIKSRYIEYHLVLRGDGIE